MTGKRYYLTTLEAWQHHAHRFASSHFIVLAQPQPGADEMAHPEISAAGSGEGNCPDPTTPSARSESVTSGALVAPPNATPILVLVEGDEGAHLALEDEPAFEALPHPLAQKPISSAAQAALSPHGVAPSATTFDAAEALARVHPLLRHRIF
jgi:hypothetical protein